MIRPHEKPKAERPTNFEKLNMKTYEERYRDKVEEKMRETETPQDIQSRWGKITKINKESAREVLGKRRNSPTIKRTTKTKNGNRGMQGQR